MYSLFTFKALHNLNLGMAKKLEECVTSYLSLESKLTNVSQRSA